MTSFIPLPDKVTIIRNAGTDDWGEPTSGSNEVRKGRVSYKTERVTNAEGIDVVSQGNVLMSGLVQVGYEDRLRFRSNGVDDIEFRPVDIRYKNDLSGKCLYTKVYFNG